MKFYLRSMVLPLETCSKITLREIAFYSEINLSVSWAKGEVSFLSLLIISAREFPENNYSI
jgi:hypothetical protein